MPSAEPRPVPSATGVAALARFLRAVGPQTDAPVPVEAHLATGGKSWTTLLQVVGSSPRAVRGSEVLK